MFKKRRQLNLAYGTAQVVAALASNTEIVPEAQDHILNDHRWAYNCDPAITNLASNPGLTPENQSRIILETRHGYYSIEVLTSLAVNPGLTPENQHLMWNGNPELGPEKQDIVWQGNFAEIRGMLLTNPRLDRTLKETAVRDQSSWKTILGSSSEISQDTIDLLLENLDTMTGDVLSLNPKVGVENLVKIYHHPEGGNKVLRRPELPDDLITDAVQKRFACSELASNPKLTTGQLTALIRKEEMSTQKMLSLPQYRNTLRPSLGMFARVGLEVLKRPHLDETVFLELAKRHHPAIDQAIIEHPGFAVHEEMPAQLLQALEEERLVELVPDAEVRDLLPNWEGSLRELIEAVELTRR